MWLSEITVCLGRGGVAAELLRHGASGGTCDVTRRLLWWISLNLAVLAAAGASTRGADSRKPGAAPPFAFFFSHPPLPCYLSVNRKTAELDVYFDCSAGCGLETNSFHQNVRMG